MKEINNLLLNNISYRFPKIDSKNYVYPKNYYNSKILLDNNKYYILKNKGKRSCLWFTYIEKKFVCILILINNNDLLSSENKFYIINVNYNPELCYNNVVLYGHYNTIYKKNYFYIDNVYNYNNYNYYVKDIRQNINFEYKLELFKYIMDYINVNNSEFNVVLPIILNNSNDLYKIIHKIPYNINNIIIYNNNNYISNFILQNNNKNISTTFMVRALETDDIYMSYLYSKNKLIEYNILLVDSYKTSIFMNKNFRTIRENNNLDTLEESDEEFENNSINKYVNLEKTLNIECEYNNKFKKWMPRRISNKDITDINNLNRILRFKN